MVCGIYCRISTDQTKQKFSLSSQKENGLLFCENNNYDYRIYSEEVSGSSIEKRYEFSKLIEDIQNKEIGIVWVVEFSRLTRDDDDASFIKKLFIEYDVRLFTNDTEVKFDSPEDLLFYQIRTAVSSYERRKLKERLIRSLQKKKDEGLKTHHRIYGWDLSDGNMYINKEEAKTIRFIYKMFNEDYSFSQIENNLIMDNHKKKNGTDRWNDHMIRSILSKPEYIGMTENTTGKLIKSKKFEAIVNKDEWNKSQERLGRNKEVSKKQKRIRKYDLSGVCQCEICGSYYYLKSSIRTTISRGKVKVYTYNHMKKSKKGYECPTLRKGISMTKFDLLIMSIYIEIFFDSKKVKRLLQLERNKKLNKNRDATKDIDKYEDKIERLKTKRKRYIDGVANELWSMDEVEVELKSIKKSIDSIQVQIDNLLLDVVLSDENKYLNELSDKHVDDFIDMSGEERKSFYMARFEYIRTNNHILKVKSIIGYEFKIDLTDIPSYWMDKMETYNGYYEDFNDFRYCRRLGNKVSNQNDGG